MVRFRDRSDAGRILASRLQEYANRPDVIVLALPRGGVPVAYEVAETLHAPLDIFVVRKLGVPGNEELAIGAIASDGEQFLNEEIVHDFAISPAEIEQVTQREQQEIERRERMYRGNRPALMLRDRTIILVDDGIATGATMHAAVAAIRRQAQARLIVASPVAAPQVVDDLSWVADQVVCVLAPVALYGISRWYDHFDQTTDQEVCDLLARAGQRAS